MTQLNQPATFTAQASTVDQLPDEKLATLTKMDLRVLRDGETGGPRAARDLCLGLLGSGVIGVAGLAATVSWDFAFANHAWKPFIFTALLVMIVACSIVGAFIYQSQISKVRAKSSPYSYLMERLAKQAQLDSQTEIISAENT